MAEISREALAEIKGICEWHNSKLSGSEYKRSPHYDYAWNHEYMKKNNFNYCPYCGKKIKVVE